ncbi:DUF3160 domain-containing protein [Roseimicrobium sp. ORNL1]|uniref:DUF3160 domain-containing protein n=1 Tax=Roseimicrobium sp. ORNL1 TaxID=2711231 RepID=UPI0013E162A3|nr:DUF3160 domain-containing protein [Roseimicrobium sp. ORNL1]QIF03166.1 DUF3160 domain-containing protein [Roseimicrobium sp. ORNL1]
MFSRVLLPLTIASLGISTSLADEDGPKPPKNWQEAAQRAGLTDDQSTRLEKDKFLVTGVEERQSFRAYLGGREPQFVTSDAVLNAYHVLFEETLRQQEEVQATGLKDFCGTVWKDLRSIERCYAGDASLITRSKNRAMSIMGVALKLMGGELEGAPSELKKAIEDEVALIQKAEGRYKPAMLGKPEPSFLAFEYALFRPIGFYADKALLGRYFRAVRWLQLVPFRGELPEEHLAYHMLGSIRMRHYGGILTSRSILFEALGGASDNLDLDETRIGSYREDKLTVDEALFKGGLEVVQSDIQQKGYKASPISDRLRETVPGDEDVEFRVLSTYRLPEDLAMYTAVAAQPVTQPAISPGLSFNAWLGVPSAEKLFEEQYGKEALTRLAAGRPSLGEDYRNPANNALPWWKRLTRGWYPELRYRGALRWAAEVDERAPAFMRSAAWQAKAMQTIAASWAQDRHAWVLQAKPEVHVLSGMGSPQGFVEPVPEFFMRLSWCAHTMARLASDAEAVGNPVAAVVEEMRETAKSERARAAEKPGEQEIFGATWVLSHELGTYRVPMDHDKLKNPTLADVHKLADELEKLATRVEREARPGSELWRILQEDRIRTDVLWHQLEVLCLRLSFLADKQLDRRAFTDSENNLVSGIGHELSEIMLYRGQALFHPHDDAPRIAFLSSQPQRSSMQHVGIGRPRHLYVLYPWEGKEVLCRGIVMPYHEVDASTTLTDENWRQRFSKDGERPPLPTWLQELVPATAALPKGRN